MLAHNLEEDVLGHAAGIGALDGEGDAGVGHGGKHDEDRELAHGAKALGGVEGADGEVNDELPRATVGTSPALPRPTAWTIPGPAAWVYTGVVDDDRVGLPFPAFPGPAAWAKPGLVAWVYAGDAVDDEVDFPP